MQRDKFIGYCFIALLFFVVFEIFGIFSPFFKPFFWSAILAFGFYPIYSSLKKLLGNREGLAAILMTLLVFLIVIPPILILLVNLTTQAIELYQMATSYIRDGGPGKLIDHLRSFAVVQRIETHVMSWDPIKEKASDWLLNTTKALANFSINQVGVITKNIVFVILNMIAAFFMLFIFFKDGEKIYRFLYQIAPLEDRTRKAVFNQLNETCSAVIRGQILTGITQGVVAGIIFSVLGLPVPIIFAILTFIGSLVPILGAQIAWAPLTIYLWLSGQTTHAVILLLLGLGVISTIDNILKPMIIGEKTKLPYFLLFFGILGGIKHYGITGIFFAPVILSLFFALIQIYKEKFIEP